MKERLAGREWAPRVIENLPMASYAVKTVPLDSYLSQRNIERVDFIKMDIEGAEASAMGGMERTVGRSAALVDDNGIQSRGVEDIRRGPS